MTELDPTRRFSDRVDNYLRFRPSYPDDVLEILRDETGLTSVAVIADIGSGTGISSELFLRNGNPVYGVEPNAEMRQAAERLLTRYPQFRSVAATAEATGLPEASVDYVVAGQAFHWFDVEKSKAEFTRILSAAGWVVLLWNSRRLDSTEFLRAYEGLLRRYGTDYADVQQKAVSQKSLKAVFAEGEFTVRKLYNEQRFDLQGLQGRLLSSSYTPAPSHPNHQPMLRELDRIFDRHAESGEVCFEYDTEVYFGHAR